MTRKGHGTVGGDKAKTRTPLPNQQHEHLFLSGMCLGQNPWEWAWQSPVFVLNFIVHFFESQCVWRIHITFLFSVCVSLKMVI